MSSLDSSLYSATVDFCVSGSADLSINSSKSASNFLSLSLKSCSTLIVHRCFGHTNYEEFSINFCLTFDCTSKLVTSTNLSVSHVVSPNISTDLVELSMHISGSLNFNIFSAFKGTGFFKISKWWRNLSTTQLWF